MRTIFAALTAALLMGPNLAFAAGGQAADQAQKPSAQFQASMSLYAAGISLGKVDMDATFRGDDYHVVSNLTTSGVVNAFWQSQIQATSTGKITGGKVAPSLYDSF